MQRRYYHRPEWPAGLRLYIGDGWARWMFRYRLSCRRYVVKGVR